MATPRTTRLAVIVLVILAAIGGFIWHRSASGPAIKATGDGPIVAFGDSLVAGYGATAGNDLVSILSRRIGEQIVNKGVPGDTTAAGLARVGDVTALKPRLAIVLFGGNDFLRKVPREETFSNLRAIVLALRKSGSAVVLVGVRSGLLSDPLESEFEKVAKETGAAYMSDALDGLFGDSRYMSDSVHPNDAGYARIADRLYPILKKIL